MAVSKVIDFGIARFFQPQATATMVGTQGYAPPEQYKGKVEARSDIYALGATMHFMLTGRDPSLEPPFMFPPVQQLYPGCSTTLADLVTEALALDIKDRVPSAADFKRRLTRLKSPTATSIAPLPSPRRAASNAPTIVALDAPLCAYCGKTFPADARFCPYCNADLSVSPQLPAQEPKGTWARIGRWIGGMLALLALAFAVNVYYKVFYLPKQRELAARAYPLKLDELTLALSTRTGEGLTPPAASFKDTEIASDKYLKWSATFDNELAGIGSVSEKVEARFYDPNGNQIASSDAEQMVSENDSFAVFGGVALIPDGVVKNHGQYKVGLYLGDQTLGGKNFAISEDLAGSTPISVFTPAARTSPATVARVKPPPEPAVAGPSAEDETTDEDSETSSAPAAPPGAKGYNIQIEALMDKSAVDEMILRLKTLGYNPQEWVVVLNGQTWYRVRVGPYATAEEATAAQNELHERLKQASNLGTPTSGAAAPEPNVTENPAAGGSPTGGLPLGDRTIELPAEARSFVDKIERDAIAKPNDVVAWNKFGAVSKRAAMFDRTYYGKAEEAYSHVLKLDPDNLDALRSIGDIDYDKQLYDEAIAAFEHYLRKKSDDPEVRTDLGTMFLYTGNADQAIVQYKKAIAEQPGFFQAYYNMGIAYAQINKAGDAEATLNKAMTLAPDDKARAQVSDLITKLNAGPTAR